MSNQVLIDIMQKNKFDSGNKARNDVAKILTDLDFQATVMFDRSHNNILRTVEIIHAAVEMERKASEFSVIVLQYPYQPAVMKFFLKRISRLRKEKKVKFVILIHDIHYLRDEGYLNKSIEKLKQLEIGFFNTADALIVHNDIMKSELKEKGVNVTMVILEAFDYLYSGIGSFITENDKLEIVFAGNLSQEKSGFIYQYEPSDSVEINLYGSVMRQMKKGMNYKGNFPPDKLIENMEGNYGLVWDGPSADTCAGNYGNYLRYNNPHKFSLYLAAGLPVIVWNKSALASLVLKKNIGFCIEKLSDLDNLPAVNSEEYMNMRENVMKMSDDICKGNYLRKAIECIIGT